MARGSVTKRCECRDAAGRQVKGCKKRHGSWTYVIDVGDIEGKRKQNRRSGFATRDEAEEAMTKALAALDAGIWTDDRGITVGAWLDEWLTLLEHRAPKTVSGYRGHVEDIWKPTIGKLRLRDLRHQHIDTTLRGQDVSASTRDSYRRTLRSALSEAQARSLITINPAAGRMLAIGQTRPAEMVIWQPEQTALFLEATADHEWAALFELAAFEGMRRAELCGVRWPDIEAGVSVRQTLAELARDRIPPHLRACPYCTREHTGRYFKPAKSEAGDRWIPVVEPARLALEAHRKRQDADRAAHGAGYADHQLVFCQSGGEPLRPGDVTKEFARLVTDLGLPDIDLHGMRHGACSMLLAGGVPIEIVQMILGHSSPAVVRRVYAHVLRGATSEQMQSASDLITRHRRDQNVTGAADPLPGPEAD